MKRTPLKRNTEMKRTEMKRTEIKRKSPGKAARRRQFSQSIRDTVIERSGNVCEWCHNEWITNIHHCKFRSQLTKSEGSGGLENALGIGAKCDALVHSGKEGRKYQQLFAERARQLANGQTIHA